MSIAQENILEKINTYLSELGRSLLNEENFGYSLVQLYCLKDKLWLSHLLNKIANATDESLSEDIEYLLDQISTLHPINSDSNNVEKHDEYSLTKEFSLAFVFIDDELALILDNINSLLQKINPPVYITFQSTNHTLGVNYRDEKYYLYDPNHNGEHGLEIACDDIETLCEQVKERFFTAFEYDAEHMPIALTLLSRNAQAMLSLETREENTAKALEYFLQQREESSESYNIELKSWDNITALLFAAKNDAYIEVSILLEAGANTSITDNQGRTALIYAAEMNHAKVIATLLELEEVKNNVNTKDALGNTALHYAIDSGNADIIAKLLANGANLNAANNNNVMPLSIAAMKGHTSIIEPLIQAGVNINFQDSAGRTALMFAVVNNQAVTVKSLLKHSANPNLKTQDGDTALHFAVSEKNFEIIELLIQAKANPNVEGSAGYFPLDYAIMHSDLNSIRALHNRSLTISDKENTYDQIAQVSQKLFTDISQMELELKQSHDEQTSVEADLERTKMLLNILGLYYNSIHQYDAAYHLFQKYFKLESSTENFYQIILTLIDSQKIGEAQHLIKEHIIHLKENNQHQAALEICNTGIKLFPHSKDLHVFEGDFYLHFNNPEKALQSYTTAISCGNGNKDVYLLNKHGNLHLQIGQTKENDSVDSKAEAVQHYQLALKSFDHAYAINPNEDSILQSCFDCLAALKHPNIVNFQGDVNDFRQHYEIIRKNILD